MRGGFTLNASQKAPCAPEILQRIDERNEGCSNLFIPPIRSILLFGYIDALYQTNETASSPRADYPIYFTTPGTYTLWLRGYPANAAGDSVQVGLRNVITTVTGFAPGVWGWSNKNSNGQPARVNIPSAGLYTLNLWIREDGLRIDRLLLTTNTNFIPTGFGPAETDRFTAGEIGPQTSLTRTIVYTYDDLYRLTQANYTTGQNYQYDYDEVGNRLEQIINGDTTTYLYDDANRLESVTRLSATQPYTFDRNGNLLASGVMTNTFDAANRLVSSNRSTATVQPIYNGAGDRVRQVVGGMTTYYTLDVEGLPEVITSSAGEIYVHLPGVIVTEKAGQVRYLLGDGLGSIRQAIDGTGAVVAYNEYDPYGNPVQEGSQPYGFSGEWWQEEVELLHLRARWYAPETGTFLSRDQMEWEPPYQYVRGNPINYVDRSGACTAITPVGLSTEVMMEEDCIGGPASMASPSKNTPINSSGTQNLIKTAVVVVINSCIYIINYFLDSEGKFVKVDVAPQTKVEVNPGPQTEPKLTPTAQCCPVPQPTASREPNKMRVQLQEARAGINLNTLGIPVEEQKPLGRGVTVRQVQLKLEELFSKARNLSWFSWNTYMRDLRKAIILTSQTLNEYPPIGGVSDIGNIRRLSNEFPGSRGTVYHVDVENLRGTNLRYIR